MPLRTRQQILTARKNGEISTEQATALLNALSQLQRDNSGAELSDTEVTNVLSGGTIDRRNAVQKFFGAFNPSPGSSSNVDTGIPLPGFLSSREGQNVEVNPALGVTGAALATLGLSLPGSAGGAAIAGGLSRIPFIGSALGRQVLSQTALRAGTRTAAVAGTGFLADRFAQDVDQRPPGPTLPGGTAQQAPDAATAGAGLGGQPNPPPIDPVGGEPGPLVQTPVTNQDGTPTGQSIITQDGIVVNPSFINDPEAAQAQANFLGTKEGQEFAQDTRERTAAILFQKQQVAKFEQAQRDERTTNAANLEARNVAIREEAFTQGTNQRQRAFLASESRAERDAAFVQALLPILASPGSRFRFAANVSRLGGGQAAFQPTEAFNRLFQFSGFDAGSSVPLTGEQDFSIIPNIQQFADFSPRDRDELGAIVGESSGQDLFSIGRQSQRLAPPR